MMLVKDGLIVQYSGQGDAVVTVSSSPNEGLDKITMLRCAVNSNIYADVQVNREGKREVFNASDESFITSDNDTINVIKQQYV